MTAQELSESWTWKTFPKLGALEKRGEFENACKEKRSQRDCISVPVGLDMRELTLAFSTHLSTSAKCTSSLSEGIEVDAACPSHAMQSSAVLMSFLERHCWWLLSNLCAVQILFGDINTFSS